MNQRRPSAFLLVRINIASGIVYDAHIYSERHPSQTFGDFCFALIMEGFGKDFFEGKQDILRTLKASPLMYSWLRKYYKD